MGVQIESPGAAPAAHAMPNLRNRFPARRRFLKQSAALTASSLAAPMLVVAQAAPAPQATTRAAPSAATNTATEPRASHERATPATVAPGARRAPR